MFDRLAMHPALQQGKHFNRKAAQPCISNGRYRDRSGGDLLKESPTLVAFISLLLPATEHFEESVSPRAALAITSICPAVLGGLSAFHLVRDRSLTWPTVPTPHLFIGPRQHQDDCVQMTRSRLDRDGQGGVVGLSYGLPCGLLHSVHLAGTHPDRSTEYGSIPTHTHTHSSISVLRLYCVAAFG